MGGLVRVEDESEEGNDFDEQSADKRTLVLPADQEDVVDVPDDREKKAPPKDRSDDRSKPVPRINGADRAKRHRPLRRDEKAARGWVGDEDPSKRQVRSQDWDAPVSGLKIRLDEMKATTRKGA